MIKTLNLVGYKQFLRPIYLVRCIYISFARPTVAGIHGGEDGCYSIALSGGYEDDLDYGECFTYTGEGMFYSCVEVHSRKCILINY